MFSYAAGNLSRCQNWPFLGEDRDRQTGFVQMATKQENYKEDVAVAEKHATFATGLLRTGGGWVDGRRFRLG